MVEAIFNVFIILLVLPLQVVNYQKHKYLATVFTEYSGQENDIHLVMRLLICFSILVLLDTIQIC